MSRHLVILPTFGERENLGTLLPRLLGADSARDVLVVDDDSGDGTPLLVQAMPEYDDRLHLLTRPAKSGYASAIVEGLRFALNNGYDRVVQMDADFSHDPDDIPLLLRALEGAADMVIGSRYTSGGGVRNWPKRRRFLSRFGARYATLFTGLPVTDPTAGFRAINRRLLTGVDWLRLRSGGYSFQVELNYACWKLGYKIREVPIVFTERRQGQSKMSAGIIVEAVWRVPLLRFVSPRRYGLPADQTHNFSG